MILPLNIGLMGLASDGMLITPNGKNLFRVSFWLGSRIQRTQHWVVKALGKIQYRVAKATGETK